MNIALLALGCAMAANIDGALGLNPANPHYLQFRGRPTVLISSTEHYSAVLNLDFDQKIYLDALKRDGMYLTRTFSGVYCEDPKSFNIRDNTLAPGTERYITPWARSDSPGYPNGGNRFDLTKWDEAHFHRLK